MIDSLNMDHESYHSLRQQIVRNSQQFNQEDS
jgi:hypothetical protein